MQLNKQKKKIESTLNDEFFLTYTLGIPFGPTDWCDMSISFEYYKGLDAILKLPEVQKSTRCAILVVSGSDIPIQSKTFFIKEDYKQLTEDSFNCTEIETGCYFLGKILTKTTVTKLCNYYFEDNYKRLSQIYNTIIQSSSPGRTTYCPDEYLDKFYLIEEIALKIVHYNNRTCTYFHSRINSYSPLEWKSWNDIHKLSGRDYFTLIMALLYARIKFPFGIVFRKVMFSTITKAEKKPSIEFFEKILWNDKMNLDSLIQYSNCNFFVATGYIINENLEIEQFRTKFPIPILYKKEKSKFMSVISAIDRLQEDKKNASQSKIIELSVLYNSIRELIIKKKISEKDLFEIFVRNNYNTKTIFEKLTIL